MAFQADTEIETYVGDYVDLANPNPERIHIEDIAQALANTCRYSGHVKRYYSVAEHSVLCLQYAVWKRWKRKKQIAVFHHDDAEAYLGDIVRPFKKLLGDTFRSSETKVDAAICEALKLPFGPEEFKKPYVKEADDWALRREARDLLPSKGNRMKPQMVADGPIVFSLGMSPAQAKEAYMEMYERLSGG